MPPPVATLLTLGFIVFLFRRDIRERPNVTGALWIPLVWILIICSRQTSEWLNIFGLHLGAASLEEGSPLDACVYFALIAAGAVRTQQTASAALGDYSEQSMAYDLLRLLLPCHLLVGLSIRGFQAMDQGAGPPNHGAYRPHGTGSCRRCDQANEKVRLRCCAYLNIVH